MAPALTLQVTGLEAVAESTAADQLACSGGGRGLTANGQLKDFLWTLTVQGGEPEQTFAFPVSSTPTVAVSFEALISSALTGSDWAAGTAATPGAGTFAESPNGNSATLDLDLDLAPGTSGVILLRGRWNCD